MENNMIESHTDQFENPAKVTDGLFAGRFLSDNQCISGQAIEPAKNICDLFDIGSSKEPCHLDSIEIAMQFDSIPDRPFQFVFYLVRKNSNTTIAKLTTQIDPRTWEVETLKGPIFIKHQMGPTLQGIDLDTPHKYIVHFETKEGQTIEGALECLISCTN
jgi:hypothetical protein